MESYLNSLSDLSFLLYPYHSYNVAVLWNGKKVVVKPIIGFSLVNSYFKWKGKNIFLRNFREEDSGTIPPEWATDWLKERINKKPFKMDMRMNDQDKFVLDRVIQKRKVQIEGLLNIYQNDN